jgi:hypothetical protein
MGNWFIPRTINDEMFHDLGGYATSWFPIGRESVVSGPLRSSQELGDLDSDEYVLKQKRDLTGLTTSTRVELEGSIGGRRGAPT